MRYYECPMRYDGGSPSLFLGGGITGCANWQAEIRHSLSDLDTDWVLLNPRRATFDPNDADFDKIQIPWEHDHLSRATALLFWFPPETLCPITLYELGRWTPSCKPMLLGIHPDYKRRKDVELQTWQERPLQKICYSLEDLTRSARDLMYQAPAI